MLTKALGVGVVAQLKEIVNHRFSFMWKVFWYVNKV
jgi:hypothetical protein